VDGGKLRQCLLLGGRIDFCTTCNVAGRTLLAHREASGYISHYFFKCEMEIRDSETFATSSALSPSKEKIHYLIK
jgi:hypothetical protein